MVQEQLGLVGFFYPTAAKLPTGALTSGFPELLDREAPNVARAFTGWTYPPRGAATSKWTNAKNYLGDMPYREAVAA